MVAKVEKALEKKFERSLKDTRIAIFGATGVVGFCTAVIAAKEGAKVTLAGHDGVERVKQDRRGDQDAGSAWRSMPPTARPMPQEAAGRRQRSDPGGRQGGRSGDLEGAA